MVIYTFSFSVGRTHPHNDSQRPYQTHQILFIVFPPPFSCAGPLSNCSVPVVNANDITALNINGKESLWIDRGWRAGDTDKDSGLSETKLLGNSNSMQSGNYTDGGTDYAEVDTRNMSTFYNCRKVRRADALISISRKWRRLIYDYDYYTFDFHFEFHFFLFFFADARQSNAICDNNAVGWRFVRRQLYKTFGWTFVGHIKSAFGSKSSV